VRNNWLPKMEASMLNLAKIKEELKTACLGNEIHCFVEVGSTNEVAKALAAKGAKEGTVVIAETQTSGKGRLGRKWFSPKGGIWLSLILRPKIKPKDALKLTLTAAVAVARAIKENLNVNVSIKWPNDVLVENKKVCGILTEGMSEGDEMKFVIVGVGINANFDLAVLPRELWENTTTLREVLGRNVDREAIIRSFLEYFEICYNKMLAGNFKHILSEWKNFASFLGKRIVVSNTKEKMEGIAQNIDEDGSLIVRLEKGDLVKVFSGDVSIRYKN